MNKKKKFLNRFFFFIILAGCLICLYPLIWMFISSFKEESTIFKDKSLLIRSFTLFNYQKGFAGISGVPFMRYMLNTLTICIPVVIGTILSSAMTAYAFVRVNFKFKNLFFMLMIFTMLMPAHAALIPRFIMFKKLGWTGTYLPLIVPAFFATSAFFVFLFVQFMRGIPRSLDESARLDGCGYIGIFIYIIMPLCVPAIVTAAIFSFIWTYDDFLQQLIYIDGLQSYTVSLALRQYTEALEQSAFGVLFAMSVIALIPLALFFIFCQKYLVEGIATSGIKG